MGRLKGTRPTAKAEEQVLEAAGGGGDVRFDGKSANAPLSRFSASPALMLVSFDPMGVGPARQSSLGDMANDVYGQFKAAYRLFSEFTDDPITVTARWWDMVKSVISPSLRSDQANYRIERTLTTRPQTRSDAPFYSSIAAMKPLHSPTASVQPRLGFGDDGRFYVNGKGTLIRPAASTSAKKPEGFFEFMGNAISEAGPGDWLFALGTASAAEDIATGSFGRSDGQIIADEMAIGSQAVKIGRNITPGKVVPKTRILQATESVPPRQLVNFDGDFATRQLLGTTTTPDGRQIMFHAASRMVNPPKGRVAMSPAQVDEVLNGATGIVKRQYHPMGSTLTIENINMPGRPRVIVDEATGQRVITVINPKKR